MIIGNVNVFSFPAGISEASTVTTMSASLPGCITSGSVRNVANFGMTSADRRGAFYSIIRSKHPDTPVLFVEDPIFTHSRFNRTVAREVKDKNETLQAVFQSLKKRGEKNIYLLSSEDIIGHDGEATVDGVHFTDLGFMRYAEVLYPVLKKHMKE